MSDSQANEPVDPDYDPHEEGSRAASAQITFIAAIGLGGGIGALARLGLSELLPTAPARFPLGTFTVNIVGCFLIGVLMVLVTERWRAHHLVRPFLGVGVLGGFTTFSTYAVEIHSLMQTSSVALAMGYLAATVIAALVAVVAGVAATRALTSPDGGPR